MKAMWLLLKDHQGNPSWAINVRGSETLMCLYTLGRTWQKGQVAGAPSPARSQVALMTQAVTQLQPQTPGQRVCPIAPHCPQKGT